MSVSLRESMPRTFAGSTIAAAAAALALAAGCSAPDDFWIFLKTLADPSTNIWKLETDDRSVTNVYPDTGFRIVGAGVSTCAPIILI